MEQIKVTSPNSKTTYVATGRIAKTEEFTAYSCTEKGVINNCCILKIAKDKGYNATLDREAYILNLLLNESKNQEEAFQKENPGTEMKMNYHFTFPKLVETFISEDQDSRRILILDLSHVANSLSGLTPLLNIERKEEARVDQRSSAWIMGKTLKALIFVHNTGIIVNNLSRNNILIQKEEHLVTLFDWSKAKITDDIKVKESEEIAQLAKTLIRTLGWSLKNDFIPEDTGSSKEYDKLIKRFALGKGGSAKEAHKKFYKLVNKIWPREYYEFTTHPIR